MTELSSEWRIGDSFTAGYLQSVTAAAAMRVSEHTHPIATTTQFLATAQPGPASVHMKVLARGKTLDAVRSTIRQEGQIVCTSTVTLSEISHEKAEIDRCTPPKFPPHAQCTPFESDSLGAEKPLPVLDHVRAELAPESAVLLRGSHDSSLLMRGWVQFRDVHIPMIPVTVLALLDAFPPVTYTVGRYGWAPTVEMTTYLRSLPRSDWLTVEKRGNLLTGQWLDDTTLMYDESGSVVAQSHQIFLLPRK